MGLARFGRPAGPRGDCPLFLSFLNRITGGDAELIAYLQRVFGYSLTGNVREQALFFGYGTGGKREAARLKWVGTLSGIPDLALVLPGGQIRFIEVKTSVGRLSPEQIAIHSWLVALGTPCAVCRSVGDARRALAGWNVDTREARP